MACLGQIERKKKLPQAVWFSFGMVVIPSHATSASQLDAFPLVFLIVFPVHIRQELPFV